MRRLVHLAFYRRNRWRLVIAAITTGLVFAAALIVRTQDVNTFDRRICDRVDKLARVQTTGLDRALKTLPTLAYYRQHPDELAQTLASIRDQRAQFQGATC